MKNRITKPMLAADYEDGKIIFPVMVTPKIDGIRALKVNGKLVSRSFKAIPNVAIRLHLERLLPEGADGEITCGTELYDTTSVVMSKNHPPTQEHLYFYWFDWVKDNNVDVPYTQRMLMIEKYMNDNNYLLNEGIIPLIPDVIENIKTLREYEDLALLKGYEGVILRKPDGNYKCGRSTVSEGLMIKLKKYQDSEAVIVGTEELMHNNNEPELNNVGNTVRSSKKNKLVSGDTLGSIVATTKHGVLFKIGTGYTDDIRKTLWINREQLIGKLIKYKHTFTGAKNAPRNPVFLDIRSADDMHPHSLALAGPTRSCSLQSECGKGITIFTIGFTQKTAE